MISKVDSLDALERIRQNIAKYGFHTYIVTGGGDPHYAYTIGLKQSLGFEMIMAGAYFYRMDEVPLLIQELVSALPPHVDLKSFTVELGARGIFSFREVRTSWSKSLMLGATDFYREDDIPAFQICPDKDHLTLDVPDMAQDWNATSFPGWQWLHDIWPFPIPVRSVAITNLGALRGERITEVMRWEDDEWEIFAGAGPEIQPEERRVVPLGILLSIDKSILPAVNLLVGTGFWRDDVSDWQQWGA